MSASPSPAAELSARALISRVWGVYLAHRWKGFVASLFAAVMVAVLSTELVLVMEPAVNDLLVNHKPGAMLWIPLAIVGLGLGRGIAQVAQAYLINAIGNGVVGDVQVQLFGRLVRADLARLRTQHSGSYVASVLYDASLIREAATSGVINYTQNALIVIGAFTAMFGNDPWLAVGVMIVAPFSTGVMRKFSKRTTKAARGAMVETSALSTAIMESLDGVRVVKIENREAFEEQRVADVVRRRQRHLQKGANARAAAAPATETLMTIVTAGVLVYAGWRSQTGAMNVGAFMSFMLALGMASQSLRQVANLQTVMAEGVTAARRLFAALDVEPEVREVAGAHLLPRGQGAIVLKSVGFTYADGHVALTDLSLTASRGETIALVGPSGAGKTTILNLIPRFYDATSGQILIDGHDVRHVTLASLRAQIALVTQEPFLFDDTIRANIAYAAPDASQEAIEQAARAAAAHEFILALPKGYDTPVGEAGARLSGGQRQRIAIARAFLKDAPILLLDEATSALDTESEAQVQAALARLMAGRTTILIAHRLSTVRGADRIYVVDKGRIVETGDHDALMRKAGLYARLARSQDLEVESRVKALFRNPGVQAFLGLVLAGYLILVRRTVRWRHENGGCMDRLAEGEGAIGLFWHGRILLCLGATEAWWKLRRRCMVSPSHDGEFIARALEYARWPAIRISSAKPGDTEKARAAVTALREAIDWVKGGGGLIITPDGPRGPNEVIAPGAVQIARRSGGAVFLMGFAVSPALRLKTWDKAMIPAPFGRGAVVWVGPLHAPADIGLAETEALIADWSAQLSAATRRAEAMVGAAPDIDPTAPQ